MAWKGIDSEENDYKNDAVFWEPEPKDTLEGTVKKIKKGQFNLFMVVEDDEGATWFTPQHAQLVRQIKKLSIEEGDLVHITFLGEGEQPDDPNYSAPKLYKLLKWEE